MFLKIAKISATGRIAILAVPPDPIPPWRTREERIGGLSIAFPGMLARERVSNSAYASQDVSGFDRIDNRRFGVPSWESFEMAPHSRGNVGPGRDGDGDAFAGNGRAYDLNLSSGWRRGLWRPRQDSNLQPIP